MVAIICVNREDPERPNCRYAKDFKCQIGMKVNYDAKMFYCEHYEPKKALIQLPLFLNRAIEWLLLRLAWQEERDTLFYKALDNMRFIVVVAYSIIVNRNKVKLKTKIHATFPTAYFYIASFYFLLTGWAIQRLNRKNGWKTHEVTAVGTRLNLPEKFTHVTVRNLICKINSHIRKHETSNRKSGNN
jgi:hypothetical protein